MIRYFTLALALATMTYGSVAVAQSTKEAPAGSGQRYQGILLIDPTTGQPYAASGGAGGGAVYGPDAAGSAPTKPPVLQGLLDASGNVRAVSPSFPQPISGTVSQGTPTAIANAWPVYLSQGGAALSGTNGLPTTDTNAAQTITNPGTSASKAQAVQGATGGLPLAADLTKINGTALGTPTAIGAQPTGNWPGANAYLLGGTATVGTYYPLASQPTYGGQTTASLATDFHGRLRAAETGSDDPLVGIVPNAGAGSTCSTASALTNCTPKNAPGNLYRAQATSPTAPSAQQYLVCINATSTPTAGAAITPVSFAAFNSATAVGSTAQINLGPGPGDGYTTGITCLISTSLTAWNAGTAAIISVAVR